MKDKGVCICRIVIGTAMPERDRDLGVSEEDTGGMYICTSGREYFIAEVPTPPGTSISVIFVCSVEDGHSPRILRFPFGHRIN